MKMTRRQFLSMASALGAVAAVPSLAAATPIAGQTPSAAPAMDGFLMPGVYADLSRYSVRMSMMRVVEVQCSFPAGAMAKFSVRCVSWPDAASECGMTMTQLPDLKVGDLITLEASWPEHRGALAAHEMRLDATREGGAPVELADVTRFDASRLLSLVSADYGARPWEG